MDDTKEVSPRSSNRGNGDGESGPAHAAAPRAAVARRLSRRKKWLFRLAAMALPFAVLLVLELLLIATGSGKDLRLIQPLGDGAPAEWRRFNPDADQAYFLATNLGGPEPRPFLLPKPRRTFRIVVVGASTVFGFPYPPDVAFPRLLELALRQQELDYDFEVLNAGIVAINSLSEADVVQQAVDCQPDLIVVYTGQNEFIGPGGVASKFGGLPRAWSPAIYAARRTRLFQFISRRAGLHKRDARPLLEQLPDDLSIPLHGSKFVAAENYLRGNLQKMVRIAGQSGIPVLLTTPVVNLRHQYPLASLSREGLSEQERDAWQRQLVAGENLMRRELFAKALAEFDRAWAIDDGHALLAFRRAQCLEHLDRWDEASASYQAACDLDGCRIRAPSSFGRIIAEVAEAAGAGHDVRFLDTAAAFARESPHGIPGDESFLEHVHFTYSGNWRLGLVLAEFVTRDVLGKDWRADRVPQSSARDALCGALSQDHFVAKGQVMIMLEQAPLNQGADAAGQIQSFRSDCRQYFDELPPGEAAVLGNCSLAQLKHDLFGTLAQGYENAGLYSEESVLVRRGILRQFWRSDLLFRLAECELRVERFDEANVLLDQASKWNPRSRQIERLRAEVERRRNAR